MRATLSTRAPRRTRTRSHRPGVRIRVLFATLLAVLVAGVAMPGPARAWIISEHTQITQRGLSLLLAAQPSDKFEQVLQRVEGALKLCPITQPRALAQDCLTLAILPALAGDHSCYPDELRGFLQGGAAQTWLKSLRERAREVEIALLDAGADPESREKLRRDLNVDLQSIDPDYLARAQRDDSHFQLARESNDRADLSAYLRFALGPARDANASASYVNYHAAALKLAAEASISLPQQRAELEVRALLAEVFALHFLQDAFAAGHFVGHWGSESMRLGTHDFYSGAGVEAARFRSPQSTFVARGDAFLSEEELRAAATAVAISLRQVLEVLTQTGTASAHLGELRDSWAVTNYDSCRERVVPPALTPLASAQGMLDVLEWTPVPAARFPPMQRRRAEKDFFIGGAATFGGGHVFAHRTSQAQLRATLRVGVGTAGLVEDPVNSQAFLDIGMAGQHLFGRSEMSLTGFTLRLRAPGYLTLVDGTVMLALAAIFRSDCPFCLDVASRSAGGGLGKFWAAHPLIWGFSWQVSLLRDCTLNVFRGEPREGDYRTELITPFLTARNVLAIAGDGLSQSSDFYADIGMSTIWSSSAPGASLGVFVSLTAATRIFP